jgi:hypothetical protein
MDIADASDDQVTKFTEHAMRLKRPEGPAPTGWCLWCEDPVENPKRWCCAECRDHYEHAARRFNGKA